MPSTFTSVNCANLTDLSVTIVRHKCSSSRHHNDGIFKKTIFKTLAALGACHVTIIGGMVYRKSMIFKVFEYISASF